MEMELRLDREFTEDLNDPTSEGYKELERQIVSVVSNVCLCAHILDCTVDFMSRLSPTVEGAVRGNLWVYRCLYRKIQVILALTKQTFRYSSKS